MASSSDLWLRECNEASKLADDISSMMSERGSMPSGPEAIRHTSAIRRKITILGTRLDSLDSLLTKLRSKQPMSEKELNKRLDLILNIRNKVKQVASTLNMSSFANREDLFGPSKKSEEEINKAAGMDNQGIVGFQRQIMREQDQGLDKLEETVMSTKHIALAVNEELDLHTRLIDTLDDHVESTNSGLQRVQKRLAMLSRRTKGGCTCMCMVLSVAVIVFLALIAYLLVKHL